MKVLQRTVTRSFDCLALGYQERDKVTSVAEANHFINDINVCVELTMPNASTSNSIKCRIHHLAFACLFTQEGSSSITLPNIYLSVPIGLWMMEPYDFHCPGMDAFVQRTICF